MEHTYYYYSNYDIDKYIYYYSHSLYIFYNGLNKKEAKPKILPKWYWTEVTKIRKSKSNNFKSDLSPLYTIKKMMHSLKLKFSLQQQQQPPPQNNNNGVHEGNFMFMKDSKWNKGTAQHLIVPTLIYYLLLKRRDPALKNWRQ